MNTIHVSASRDYDVFVGRGLLGEAGARVAAVIPPCRAAILTDDTVDALYGAALTRSLQGAGYEVLKFVFPHGEASKCLSVFGAALNFLAEHQFSRTDLVVALGGGVVGDLAGFVAAVYLRGIPYVQIPTTLLAAVDSSVGGKTAVDLAAGKNLAGCFYQPSLVLCDPDTLASLPERTFREGCAEVIKCGVLLGEPLFSALERTPIQDQLEDVIRACISYKRDLVEGDEFDRGDRQLLNLGHTIGHAVEAQSGYRLFHGECVAIGLAAVARAAHKMGLCSDETCGRIRALLEQTGLPTETACPADALFEICRSDKKIAAGRIRLVVPEAIGGCTLRPMALPELRDWIEKGIRA
ncbi:MAG: 3-dehydroquinate synthase [Oscillospiraceae bacterium]|nr:3-dehydroquinate synthase [Oscillospiraceae bacterium]